jgi:hypothetical protein
MWWIAPAAVGIVTVIYKLFDREKKIARERWENTYKQVQNTIEDHRRNIENHLHEAKRTYDFHLLTNLHFSSHKVADHAYQAMKDAKTSLDAVGLALVEAKKKKNELEEQKKTTKNYETKKQIQMEINQLNEMRNQLFQDKDQVKAQRDELKAKLLLMNQRTRELKLAIRDRCGYQGRVWYQKLEDRIQAKR